MDSMASALAWVFGILYLVSSLLWATYVTRKEYEKGELPDCSTGITCFLCNLIAMPIIAIIFIIMDYDLKGE